MKSKIINALLIVAIVILGVVIFRLHTKDPVTTPEPVAQPTPAPVVKPLPTPDIRPPQPKPNPEPVRYPPLEVKQGIVIKR